MPVANGGAFDIRECERLIQQIRDVISARIVADSEGNVQEIHVLAGVARGPKQIVRDIESIFMARFGVSVDHKKISIAQIYEEPPVFAGPSRVRLVSVNVLTAGPKTEARVKLQYGDTICEGVASGPSSAANRLRLVTVATISAADQYVREDWAFSVEDVVCATLGRKTVVVVALTVLTPAGEDCLVGASVVKQDERDAAARATLDALNRRFVSMLQKAE